MFGAKTVIPGRQSARQNKRFWDTEPAPPGGPDPHAMQVRAMREIVDELRGDKDSTSAEPGTLKSITSKNVVS